MKQIVEHTYLFEALVWVTLKGVSFCYERAKRGFCNKIHSSNLSQIVIQNERLVILNIPAACTTVQKRVYKMVIGSLLDELLNETFF